MQRAPPPKRLPGKRWPKARTAQLKLRSATPRTPCGSAALRSPPLAGLTLNEITLTAGNSTAVYRSVSESIGLAPPRHRSVDEVEDLLGCERRSQQPVAHALLDVGTNRPHPGVGRHLVQHGVAHHRPHPLDLLAAPAGVELPRLSQHPAVLQHRRP